MKTVNLTEEEHAELLAKRAKNPARASAPAASDVVRAAGNSEGAKKGWEKKRSEAWTHTDVAHQLSTKAAKSGSRDNHQKAAVAHEEAARRHGELASIHEPGSRAFELHDSNQRAHESLALNHRERMETSKASSAPETENVIHCRAHASAAGSVLAADKAWNPGEPVEFMWMPAGTHTICAGFRHGSIELTVNCDEKTAANVQASLDAWRAERPKQEPFGCVEHREHEASVRVSAQQAFTFKDDGVYIAAEPTVLGAQNVNGKVHRSWSPSFTTDADYSQAKTIKTASGATVMVFPEGVRGSRSNPAEITGVDFCVGTLTNKPAFHAMSPVKGSEIEAVTASGDETILATWSDAARVAAAHARERSRLAHEEPLKRSMDGKPRADEEAYSVTKQAHSASKKTKQSEIDGNGAGMHMDSHNYAAYMHTEAAKAHKKAGDSFMSELHSKAADAHREASGEIWKATHKASESTQGNQIHAHCRATLLQDVPDATDAEVACYEKCLHEGGDHNTAVLNIKSAREQGGVAASEVTPDTIAARQKAALDKVNAMAEEKGVARTVLDDVYDKVTATGTSEGAKKGWSHRGQAESYAKLAKDAADRGSLNYAAEHANSASYHAKMSSKNDSHEDAQKAHEAAGNAHEKLARKFEEDADERAEHHWQKSLDHAETANEHHAKIGSAKASDASDPNSIHANCRATPVKATWSDAARKAAASEGDLTLESIYARAGETA